MLDGFGTVCKGLGRRTKPYLPQICGTILWRLNNKSAKVRQQAADLVFLVVFYKIIQIKGFRYSDHAFTLFEGFFYLTLEQTTS